MAEKGQHKQKEKKKPKKDAPVKPVSGSPAPITTVVPDRSKKKP